jgi:hypothetical protein
MWTGDFQLKAVSIVNDKLQDDCNVSGISWSEAVVACYLHFLKGKAHHKNPKEYNGYFAWNLGR